MELVINIDADGGVQAMHMDLFDLGFLGRKEIHRASEIKFNTETQLWDILVPREGQEESPQETWVKLPEACGFAGYDEARNIEVAWFNKCRMAEVHPLSAFGRTFLTSVL